MSKFSDLALDARNLVDSGLSERDAWDVALSGKPIVSPEEIIARIVAAGGSCEVLRNGRYHAVTADGVSIEFAASADGSPHVYASDIPDGAAYAVLKSMGIAAPVKTPEEIARDLATAESYWREAVPYQGTLGEVYLRDRRRITIPLDCVGFHVGMRALIARRQWPDGTPRGLIVTRLETDGSKRDRKDLGIKDGGVAVRLAPAAPKLVLGEGVENVATVMQLTDLPGWAAGTANDLANVILPREVREVVLALDNDKAGLKKGFELRRRLLFERRKVWVEIPPRPHNDWNDYLRCNNG